MFKVEPPPRDKPSNPILILVPLLPALWLFSTSLAEPIPELGVYNAKRLLELYMFPAILVLLTLHIVARTTLGQLLRSIPKPVSVGFTLFLGIGIMSSLRQSHPGYPLSEVAVFFLLFSGTVCIATARRVLQIQFDRMVLIIIGAMGAGVFLIELSGILAYLPIDRQYSYSESLLRFSHPRFYNHVQTWTLPILVLLPLLFREHRWMGRLAYVLIGIQWSILISTGARGSIVALVTSMTVMALIAPRNCRFWLSAQAKGLAVGLFIYGILLTAMALLQPDQSTLLDQSLGRAMMTTTGRTGLWELAILDATTNPWLGSGPTLFACDARFHVASHPHSFPLQILAEWGSGAFLILAVIFSWLMSRLFITVRGLNKPGSGADSQVKICLCVAFLAAAIHSCVSGLIMAPASHVAGMLILGWLWGLNPVPDTDKAGPPGTLYRRASTTTTLAFIAIGLIVCAALLGFARTELEQLDFRTAYAVDYGPSRPRFWQDGRTCLYSFDSP